MAWLWWLLAPVASTLLGGLILMLRAAAEPNGRPRRLRRDAMAEHQALLTALGRHNSDESLPSLVRVLDRDPDSHASYAEPDSHASHAEPDSHASHAEPDSHASLAGRAHGGHKREGNDQGYGSSGHHVASTLS